jgi:hypothetical protein
MKETVNAAAPTGQWVDTPEGQGQNRTWETAMRMPASFRKTRNSRAFQRSLCITQTMERWTQIEFIGSVERGSSWGTYV